MEVREVDPFEVNVDEMNERTENLNLADLEQSVAEQGVIQPPIVRERNGDHEVPYTVVVGQRRTLAAQGAGLDTLPVVVMEWGDTEALEASITENIDTFREDVSKKDRALAIKQLLEDGEYTRGELADRLGVVENTVTYWLEPLREDWSGTIVDPEVVDESSRTPDEVDIEQIPNNTLQTVRTTVGGGEEGEELLAKIQQHDLSEYDVGEVAKKIERGKDVDQAIGEVIEEKHTTADIRVNTRVSFTGDHAGALTSYAEDRGMTENEVVREAISDYLDREGYL